jgi:hypothetical protein
VKSALVFCLFILFRIIPKVLEGIQFTVAVANRLDEPIRGDEVPTVGSMISSRRCWALFTYPTVLKKATGSTIFQRANVFTQM